MTDNTSTRTNGPSRRVVAAYLVLLAPQSGLLHAGYALAADRYSYLPTLAPALLLGAGVAMLRGGPR